MEQFVHYAPDGRSAGRTDGAHINKRILKNKRAG
jgi:hypothetical protein